MRLSRSFFALFVAIAATALANDPAKVSGTMIINAKSYPLKAAYARTETSHFEKGKKDTVLVLSDRELPADVAYDDMKMMMAADDLKFTGVILTIDPDKSVIGAMFYSPAFTKMNGFSSVGMHKAELTAMTPSRIAGKISIPEPHTFSDMTYQYTATFDVPIGAAPKAAPPPPPKGKPLPAGGGDPGKAYLAFQKSVAAGDMAAVKRGVSGGRAKEMDSPDFKKLFPLMQAMMPKNVKITGGAVDGDSATLLASGKDGNEVSTGTINMVREGGAWKVDKESWSTKSQ